MAREKFQTLTEQMFYILLCLRRECCGVDIMERVREMTGGRVVEMNLGKQNVWTKGYTMRHIVTYKSFPNEMFAFF